MISVFTSSSGLRYSVSTTPEFLAAGGTATVEVEVSNPTQASILCPGLTVLLPGEDLTIAPEAVLPSVTNDWEVTSSREDAPVFTFVPPSPDNLVEAGEEFTIRLEGILLSPTVGRMRLTITEGTEEHHVPLSKMPTGFKLEDFAPSSSAVRSGEKVTLSWVCYSGMFVAYTLTFWSGQTQKTYSDNQLRHSPGWKVRGDGSGLVDVTFTPDEPVTDVVTAFLITAKTKDYVNPEFVSQSTVVIVTGGNLRAGNLEANGSVDMFGPASGTVPSVAPTDGFLQASTSGTKTVTVTLAPPTGKPIDPGSPYTVKGQDITNGQYNETLLIPVRNGSGISVGGDGQITWIPMATGRHVKEDAPTAAENIPSPSSRPEVRS